MSCNCIKSTEFKTAMNNARLYEYDTGKKAAVFLANKGTVSFTDLSQIGKVKGICCYFTTDMKEHKVKAVKKTTPKLKPEEN